MTQTPSSDRGNGKLEALDAYLKSIHAFQQAERAQTTAEKATVAARQAMYQARYTATITVECPECGAPMGEQCRVGDSHFLNTHNERQKRAGVSELS